MPIHFLRRKIKSASGVTYRAIDLLADKGAAENVYHSPLKCTPSFSQIPGFAFSERDLLGGSAGISLSIPHSAGNFTSAGAMFLTPLGNDPAQNLVKRGSHLDG